MNEEFAITGFVEEELDGVVPAFLLLLNCHRVRLRRVNGKVTFTWRREERNPRKMVPKHEPREVLFPPPGPRYNFD